MFSAHELAILAAADAALEADDAAALAVEAERFDNAPRVKSAKQRMKERMGIEAWRAYCRRTDSRKRDIGRGAHV